MQNDKDYLAEAGHWYAPDGSPRYTVTGKNGKVRPTTLRDAREHGWLPSVSMIIKQAAAPGLERWKQQQVLLAALTLPKVSGESEQEWLARIMTDSQEQAKKARETGTAIHAAIQMYYEGRPYEPEYEPFVQAAVNVIGADGWHAERSFAHPMGYGGKLDLISDEWIIDIKTKDFTEDTKTLAWDDHVMQLAAYDGLVGLDHKIGNLFVSTTVPGLAVLHKWTDADKDRGWRMFVALLEFWQAKTGVTK